MRNSSVLQTTNGRLSYERVAHAHENLRKINDIKFDMSKGELQTRVFACFRKPDPKVLSVKRPGLRLRVRMLGCCRDFGS